MLGFARYEMDQVNIISGWTRPFCIVRQFFFFFFMFRQKTDPLLTSYKINGKIKFTQARNYQWNHFNYSDKFSFPSISKMVEMRQHYSCTQPLDSRHSRPQSRPWSFCFFWSRGGHQRHFRRAAMGKRMTPRQFFVNFISIFSRNETRFSIVETSLGSPRNGERSE